MKTTVADAAQKCIIFSVLIWCSVCCFCEDDYVDYTVIIHSEHMFTIHMHFLIVVMCFFSKYAQLWRVNDKTAQTTFVWETSDENTSSRASSTQWRRSSSIIKGEKSNTYIRISFRRASLPIVNTPINDNHEWVIAVKTSFTVQKTWPNLLFRLRLGVISNTIEKKTGLDINRDGYVGGEKNAEKQLGVDLNGDGYVGGEGEYLW